MDIALTKISSKGQIVIPSEMRKNIHEGDKIIIIKNDNQLIMKKATELDRNLAEDLEFAKRVEDAWKRCERGEFKTLSVDKFLEELKKC